jgi:hypothetical protein
MLTPQQKDIILSIFRVGFASGAQHRFECYVKYENFMREMLFNYISKEQWERTTKIVWEDILAFEKSLALTNEREEQLKNYTLSDLDEDIKKWYENDK